MRQIGLLAAAAEYAVDNHWELMKEDHRRAKEFANTVSESSKFTIDLSSVETNIVIFDVLDEGAESAVLKFAEKDIHLVQFGPNTLRATFHFQIGDEDLEEIKSAVMSFE